jgi:c-di-GMP-binding flagellar brake protein YcgR
VNISAGGVLLIVPKKIPAGTCVTLELDPEAEALELRGLVRHATEDPGIRGHGIEFVEVLPSQRDALLDYLARLQAPQSSAASA